MNEMNSCLFRKSSQLIFAVGEGNTFSEIVKVSALSYTYAHTIVRDMRQQQILEYDDKRLAPETIVRFTEKGKQIYDGMLKIKGMIEDEGNKQRLSRSYGCLR